MKKWIWAAALVVAVALFASIAVARAGRQTEVKLVETMKGVIQESVFASGTLEPAEKFEHYAPTSAVVGRVYVREGDAVRAGDKLFALDLSELERQLRTEETNLQLLVRERDQARDQAIEAMRRELEQTGTVSEETKAKADVSSYDLRVRNQQDLVASLREKLAKREVVAAGDGVVTQVAVREGQAVAQGALAVTVISVKSLEVRAKVGELDAGKLRPGMEATVTGDAFSGSYSAKLTYVAPFAKPAEAGTGAGGGDPVVEVRALLSSVGAELRPGYRATLEIRLPGEERVLAPISAVRREGDKAFVFRVENGVARQVEVKTGKEDDQHVEILEGLSAGERIVAEPSAGVRDGRKVRVR